AASQQGIPSVQLVEYRVEPSQLDLAMERARTLANVVFSSHVYRLQSSPNTWVYLTDELTIQFADTVDRAEIAAMVARLGLQAVQPVLGVPQTFVFRVTDRAAVNPIKLANQLMRRGDVLTAEPNIAIETQSHYRPSDPEYAKQWYLNHEGGPGLAPGSHISVEAAWEITRGVRSVVVAIADDGFDLQHPDFQGKGKVVAPKDFKGSDFLPTPDAFSDNHGTACAGVAIAEENAVGIVGVAPGCSFMPVRTSGYLDDATIEQLFTWMLDKGAWVMSCSWGPGAVYFPLSLRQRAVLTRVATEGRNGKGCVVVFAAGNANRPTNGSINERGWQPEQVKGPTAWLNGFAVHPDVMAVSACTSLSKKSTYSNWGANVSVAAPSDNGVPGIWLPETGYVATGPAVRVPLEGISIFTSDRLGAAGYDQSNFTAGFGGTSSATPVVAGVAALVLSVNPDLTAREVKQLLQDTADKIVDPDPDVQLGFQWGRYDASGHSQWFGYGRVNAMKAVQEAQRRLRSPSGTGSTRITRQIRQANATLLTIPDDSPAGQISEMRLTDAAIVQDIQISLEIEHEFMGDLEIRLIPPNDRPILLQGRTLGRLKRLSGVYSLQTTPLLRQCLGVPAAGSWRLKLVDCAPLHTGTLKRWELVLGV
ncbi:MAG TPA: S8 family serine peptidase, partial [Chroococcidiopsis sp.]